ncbi:transcription factor E2F5-like isoform X2 [Parambassis ranga]|uniref:Transcription factor E2F5-like isoform X2 n=1 Tax=Parambassis ranga TaxID=210632 RepID=A0A6P7I4M5_9TELE|nr:transcription factor E2F5-like isoform X2 [Parambassis ranga]XP_028257806.1 transcription factor E2F5-like isoform X2 [Parambassis ranga]XP_028257807.1 transcription factor E2F5-like isoform X2 [Parambassis ranga]
MALSVQMKRPWFQTKSLNTREVQGVFTYSPRGLSGYYKKLKMALKLLAFGQKRRIYDITNVLEGTGLIVKMSKRMVKWNGAMPGENTQESLNRLAELKCELRDLEQKEFILDQQKLWVEQSIRNTTEDCNNLTYVNHEDICSCFTGNTLLAVRAPSGTQLDVPIPKAIQNSPAQYQIHLKSVRGPIDVTLLNKQSVSSDPVVLPVPPSKELLQSAMSAMSSSNEKESSAWLCQASANNKHNTDSRWTAMAEMRRLNASFRNIEPKRTNGSKLLDMSKELRELLDPRKEIVKTHLFTQLLASGVFSPLFHRSPPPSEQHVHNLQDSESTCDRSDIPVLDVPVLNS